MNTLNNNKEIVSILKNNNIVPNNISLYITAITHPSFQFKNKLNYNYQNLEFLGDSLIRKYIAEYLFNKYNNPGDMTKEIIKITNGNTLSFVAKQLNLQKVILVSNTSITSIILNDCFEAFVAAIYLDQGDTICFDFIKSTLIKSYENGQLQKFTDYKTKLNELSFKKYNTKIEYVCNENKTSAMLNDKILFSLPGKNNISTQQKLAKNIIEKNII